MRIPKMPHSAWLVFLLLIVYEAQTDCLPELAAAQSLTSQEALTSWWASATEPSMQDTEGTLRNPESVKVRVFLNNELRTLSGYEAVVFLLARNYVEWITVNGQLRLRTTAKYEAWKKSKLVNPPPPPKPPVPPPQPPGSGGTIQISLQLNPDLIARRLATFRQRGEDESFKTSSVTLSLTPDPGKSDQGRAEVSPSSIEHVQRWTMANGEWFETRTIMTVHPGRFSDLFPGQGGRVSGPIEVRVEKRNKADQTWKFFTQSPPGAMWNGLRTWNTNEWKISLAGEEVNQWVTR